MPLLYPAGFSTPQFTYDFLRNFHKTSFQTCPTNRPRRFLGMPARLVSSLLRLEGVVMRGAAPASVPAHTFGVEHLFQAAAIAAGASALLHPESGGWCRADCRFACVHLAG